MATATTSTVGATVDGLNRLIETCQDSEQGFQTVADVLKEAEQKKLFLVYAQQRTRFATELKEAVRGMQATPPQLGTLAGAAHSGWINLKAVITSGDTKAILEESERAEENTLRTYEQVLAMGLPSELQDMVQQQYDEVKVAYDAIRGLEQNPATSA
jgi:uncharacterized protein (TIGR02284 family)